MPVGCPKCQSPLPNYFFVAVQLTPCPICGAELMARAFPALVRASRETNAGDPVLEGEAGCFYHPHKRAVVPCNQCGRFLCGLCNVEFKGRNWCPACLEAGARKRKETDLENHRPLYDSVALMIATLPCLLIWPAVVGGPIALYVSIRHWKSPGSILPRTKIRFVLAILAALGEIGFLVTMVFFLFRARRT